MNASDHIFAIAEFCEKIGLTVCLHDFDLNLAGQYDHDKRLIRLNEPNVESALMALAHELGHYVGYLIYGSNTNRSRSQLHRERQAYVYGWIILKWFRATSVISRERWIAECRASHEGFVQAQVDKSKINTRLISANASSSPTPITVLSDGGFIFGGC